MPRRAAPDLIVCFNQIPKMNLEPKAVLQARYTISSELRHSAAPLLDQNCLAILNESQ